MKLKLSSHFDKKEVFKTVKEFLEFHHFSISDQDEKRPWGGFFVIDESQSKKFIEFFFKEVTEAHKETGGKISPKILIVEAEKRLSWQYHHRRSEVWKVIEGEVGVITSNTDEEGPLQIKQTGDVIILRKGERHRLVGGESWGVIAEIWQHTDKEHPSNEEDIVRVQDDFGR